MFAFGPNRARPKSAAPVQPICCCAAHGSSPGLVEQTRSVRSPRTDVLPFAFTRELERLLTELSFLRHERRCRIEAFSNLLGKIGARCPHQAVRLSRNLPTLIRALGHEPFKNRRGLVTHLLDHYEAILRGSFKASDSPEASLLDLPAALVQDVIGEDRTNTSASKARDDRLRLIFAVEILKAAADTLLCPDGPMSGNRTLALLFAAALVLAPEQTFLRTVIAVRSKSQSPAALYLQPAAFMRQYRLVRSELLDSAVAAALNLPDDANDLLPALQNARLVDGVATARLIDDSARLIKQSLWAVGKKAASELTALLSPTQSDALKQSAYDYLHVETVGTNETVRRPRALDLSPHKKQPIPSLSTAETLEKATSAENTDAHVECRAASLTADLFQDRLRSDSDIDGSEVRFNPTDRCDTHERPFFEAPGHLRVPLFDVLLGVVAAPGLAGWARAVLAQALESVQTTVAHSRSQADFYTVGLSRRHHARLAFEDKPHRETSETHSESKADDDYAQSLKIVAGLLTQYDASETLTQTRSAAATALKAQTGHATDAAKPCVPTPAGLFVPETLLDVPPKLWLSPMEALGLAARCKRSAHESIPAPNVSIEREQTDDQPNPVAADTAERQRPSPSFHLEPGVLLVFFESAINARAWLGDDRFADGSSTPARTALETSVLQSPSDKAPTALRSRTLKTFLLLDAMARLVTKLTHEGNEARGTAALQAYKAGFALTGPAADKEAAQAIKSLLAPEARRKLSRASFAELAHGYLMHEASVSSRSQTSETPPASGLEGVLAAIRADRLNKSPKRLKRLRRQLSGQPMNSKETTRQKLRA